MAFRRFKKRFARAYKGRNRSTRNRRRSRSRCCGKQRVPGGSLKVGYRL